MIYQCPKCMKHYDHKYNYIKHLSRKTDCSKNIITIHANVMESNQPTQPTQPTQQKNLEPNEIEITRQTHMSQIKTKINGESNKCLICNKTYANSGGLSKHKKKYHPNYDIELNEQNSKILITKKDFNEINNKIKILEDKINHSTQYNMINNGTINTTNIINTSNTVNINSGQLVKFGKENIYELDKDEIKKI
jgi:hypothetical protein